MNSMQTVDVTAVDSWKENFVEERLGPKPRWEGYGEIEDQSISRLVYSKVGFIHAQSAEVGRGVIAIGQALLEIKENLTKHGQFMACVKAEFGWSQPWAYQLMQIAKRFSNHNSSYELPSSAKVLALLAAANADDATVQQAAEEQWTVKETKRRTGGERQRERTLVQEALSALKLSAEARQLAARAEHISTRQLMDELEVEELPKGKEHKTAQFTFCKNGSGWWKLPIQQPIDTAADVDKSSVSSGQPPTERVVSHQEAATLLGKKPTTLSVGLSRYKGGERKPPSGNGWVALPHPARGMCLVKKQNA